jgi:hypothetical protein
MTGWLEREVQDMASNTPTRTPGGFDVSSLAPFLSLIGPALANQHVRINHQDILIGPFLKDLFDDLADGHLNNTPKLIGSGLPLALQIIQATQTHPAVEPPAPVAPAPAAPVVAPVVVAPVAPPAPPAGVDDIGKLKVHLGIIEDRNGRQLSDAEIANIQNSNGNMDDGARIHTDCTPFGDSGSEYVPGDARWNGANRSWPNGAPVFPYYEADGKLTSILHGDQGTPWVEPQSVADDNGCTVTFHVAPTDGQQHTFRYGYLYRRHDGTIVDSGLIGRGNVVNGTPYTIR